MQTEKIAETSHKQLNTRRDCDIMINTVVIIMSNKNALVAMAHVSENSKNPYYNYGEYIKYCLYTNEKDFLSIKEIRGLVKEEFGIYIPHNVFSYCLSLIGKEGLIKKKDSRVYKTGSFDVEKFEQIRDKYQLIEQSLINNLIEYVAKYDIKWDYETARRELIKVLDCNGLAYEIFIHEKDISEETINDSLELQIESDEDYSDDVEEIDSQPLYSNSFYVGRFISQLLKTDCPARSYLRQVCEGLMISIGANQLPSSGTKKAIPQIKGTKFYFDTRILLRFVGCAGEAAVKASKELVEMIQKAGGVICYFPHTLSEMNHALDDAILYKRNEKAFLDFEMRLYAQDKNPTVISAKKANLVNELAKSHIYEKPLAEYDEKDKIRFGYDYNDWKQFLVNNLNWNPKTIENDAMSIWETHMDRHGDYSSYCGTNKRLSVFVTNNSRLVGVCLKYKDNRSGINNISEWRGNSLPVITDVRLTCRLWSPSEQCERMALLYLTSNAVAAQRPTQKYVNEMRKLISQISEEVPEYDSICLSEYFNDNVTETFLETNLGRSENFNVGNLVYTMKELTEYRAIEEQKKTQEAKNKLTESEKALSKTQEDLKNQQNDIINSAIEANKDTLGKNAKVVLFGIKHWSIIIGCIITAIVSLVSLLNQQVFFLLIILVPVILCIVEYIITGKAIRRKLIHAVLPRIIQNYKQKINNNLREVELPFAEEIVNGAVDKTDLIKKTYELTEKK